MKVTLTMNEVVALVRNQYRFHDDDNIQVEIEGFVKANTTGTEVDNWIDVPFDWSETVAPPEAISFCKIEIMLRDGSIDKGFPDDWNISWLQQDIPNDIVKFRKVS